MPDCSGDYEAVIRRACAARRHDENLNLDLAIAYRKSGMLDEDEQTLKQGLAARSRLRTP